MMVFIRYIDDNDVQGIKEQIYCYKELYTRTTADAIFNLLNEQIEKMVYYGNGVCQSAQMEQHLCKVAKVDLKLEYNV